MGTAVLSNIQIPPLGHPPNQTRRPGEVERTSEHYGGCWAKGYAGHWQVLKEGAGSSKMDKDLPSPSLASGLVLMLATGGVHLNIGQQSNAMHKALGESTDALQRTHGRAASGAWTFPAGLLLMLHEDSRVAAGRLKHGWGGSLAEASHLPVPQNQVAAME